MDKRYIKGVVTGVVATLLFLLAIFLSASIVCNGIGFYTGARAAVLGDNTNATLSKMGDLKAYIDRYFMDDIDNSKISEGIYKGMLTSLEDPYSCYYTKEEYDAMMEDSSGKYCGIGASVTQETETGLIYIVTPFEGGAAYEAGIESGDIISKVEGKDVTGQDLNEVVSRMKGKPGTKVEVEFFIAKEKEYKTFTLERKEVEVPTVEYEMKQDQIGYIAVSAFDEPTDEQFISAVKDLQKQEMKGLVIDLRNNGGGMLETVVNMLDYMLPAGDVIVSTKDKNGKGDTFKAESKDTFELPLVVLINGNTASASEVFSGAIQDYKMGSLVGTTSFGKGIVQSVFPMGDGSAIKITTSKYYTPNGRNIHGTGIEPDVEVILDKDGNTDNQYVEAVKVLKAKMKTKK